MKSRQQQIFSPSSSLSPTATSPSQQQNPRLEIRAALKRQQEMVQRIKEIQSLSPSPYIQSAFTPSISSSKPRKHKAEFHSRAFTPISASAPPKAELQDLSATTAATGNANLMRKHRNNNNSPASVVRKQRGNNNNNNIKAQQQGSLTEDDSDFDQGLSSSFKSKDLSQVFSAAAASAATVSNNSDNENNSNTRLAMLSDEKTFRKAASSPVAQRIFSESRQVHKFSKNLDRSKQNLERQVRIAPSEVLIHDDIRVTRATKKQQSRANFLRGVMTAGGGGRNNNNNTRSSSSLSVRRPNSGMATTNTTHHHHQSNSNNEQQQNDDDDEWKFSPQRVLTPNPDVTVSASPHSKHYYSRFVSTVEGSNCFVRRANHAPTDFTRSTCKFLCQYKSLQNAAKKITGEKNVNLSALEAQVKKSSSSPTTKPGSGGRSGGFEDEEQQSQNSAATALAEISKRRGGLVRGVGV